jgi:SP family galactose:H+ symporter-like MFS transporter
MTTEFRNVCTLTGMVSVGAMLSSYLSKYIIQTIQRRHIMILSDLIYTVATLLSLAYDKYSFIIARFIVGIAVGLNNCIILLYIKEISPDSHTRITGSMQNAMLNFGIIIGLVFNLPIKDINNNYSPE